MAIDEGPKGYYDEVGRYHPPTPFGYAQGGVVEYKGTSDQVPAHFDNSYVILPRVASESKLDQPELPHNLTDAPHNDKGVRWCERCVADNTNWQCPVKGCTLDYNHTNEMRVHRTGGDISREGYQKHHPAIKLDLEAGTQSDPVNHPAHYTNGPKCQCGRSIECIDITRFFSLLRGTAIKYLWRANYKGNRRQDLEKARWYIQKELDTMEDE